MLIERMEHVKDIRRSSKITQNLLVLEYFHLSISQQVLHTFTREIRFLLPEIIVNIQRSGTT
jgi:hypothetical protein